MEWLKRKLAHPLAPKDVDLDSPECTEARKRIIRETPFLRKIYELWYRTIVSGIPPGDRPVLEIGSGAGFFREFFEGDELITSDIIPLRDVRRVLDAQKLDEEFEAESLRAITMVNVMHHLPDVRKFFAASASVLRNGGVLSVIEPWVSIWSRLIYSKLHHEPFQPRRKDWGFESSGPLSGSNQALPWILFSRDRAQFESEFPQFEIMSVKPMMPFSYLVSGGVSMRPLQPAWMFGFWRFVDWMLKRPMAMFAHIVIRKRGD